VIGLINIEPNEMAHLNSEFLLTGLGNENGEIVLVSPEQKVPNGSRLF
jgi:tRNA-binding protein